MRIPDTFSASRIIGYGLNPHGISSVAIQEREWTGRQLLFFGDPGRLPLPLPEVEELCTPDPSLPHYVDVLDKR